MQQSVSLADGCCLVVVAVGVMVAVAPWLKKGPHTSPISLHLHPLPPCICVNAAL